MVRRKQLHQELMKIFLDTADTEIIKKYWSTGLIDGITTNPSLIMKSGRNPEDVYQELVDLGVPDISMEVVGSDLEMYDEGIRLYEKFGPVCTVKVPCTVKDSSYVSDCLNKVSKQCHLDLQHRQFLRYGNLCVTIRRTIGRSICWS